MDICGIVIITNPDYRMDPARQAIRQALTIMDHVVVCHGRAEDADDVLAELRAEYPDRVHSVFVEWPQPEWQFEQLPIHLNAALEVARELEPDWIIRFDADTFIHEKDGPQLRQKLDMMRKQGVMIGTLEKYQFYVPGKAYEKGKVPQCLNADFPIVYGVIRGQYSDLCQPIIAEDEVEGIDTPAGRLQLVAPIPRGKLVAYKQRESTGVHAWNYDYTFKTMERARELLYHFDRAHARFWGAGWAGRHIDEITPDTALVEYLAMSTSRVKKAVHTFTIDDHPHFIQDALRNLSADQFGHDMWGRHTP